MRNPIWVPALLLAALFALQSTASNGQEIGSATSVKPQAKAPTKAARGRFRVVALSMHGS